MNIAHFKLIQKEKPDTNLKSFHKNDSKRNIGESCNIGFIWPATGKNHDFITSLNNACPNNNSIKDVKIYEELKYYILYNKVCTVTEGICID